MNKWRERIKNEMEFVSRFASQHAGDEEEAAPMEKRWTHGLAFSLDVRRRRGRRDAVPDEGRARHVVLEQRLKEFQDGVPFTGGVKLSSHAVGCQPQGLLRVVQAPLARQPIIRDSFFRSTGVEGNSYATGGAM